MCEKAWSRSWSKHPEPACAGPEEKLSAPDTGAEWCDNSSEGKPSDEKVNYYLAQLREELGEIRKRIDFSDDGVSLALASVCNFERHLAAQERWSSQETAKSPAKDRSVERQIAALRESLGDESPQETKSSSLKEEELVLVRPVKGVDKEGRLILGDPKILRASALKS